MVCKTLEFYDVRTGKKHKLKDYNVKVIKTKHGMKKLAIGEVNGNKVYRFVKLPLAYFEKCDEFLLNYKSSILYSPARRSLQTLLSGLS